MSLAPALVEPLEPEPRVEYQRVLAGPGSSLGRSVVGIALLLSLYVVVVSLVSQAIVALGWLAVGRPLPFPAYLKESLGFLHPIGLVATNLALALLTVMAMVVARLLHGRRPRWMASVQPGMRWRYLLICLVVAAVVLNAMLLLTRGTGEWRWAPQQQVWLWLAIILATSPLQAVGEEYFFRGYLLQALGSMPRRGSDGWGRWFGVVTSALVFALFHGTQNLPLFVDRFGFGLLAGALVVMTGGLEAGIACHVANNLFAFGWAALGGGIAQARALQAITWGTAMADIAGFAVFAAAAWWLSRRMNLATRSPGRRDFALPAKVV